MNNTTFKFHPRVIDALKNYDSHDFFKDVTAGVTVAVVALPLAMAFAIASGAGPGAGIFTAIIAGFLISALGGSRVQIGGPAGAFIVVIYNIIDQYGLPNLLISTILAGILLFAMGLFRLGSLIRYVPVPIIIGFTNGIAILIALSQMRDFFGLKIEKMPGDFFAQINMLSAHFYSIDFLTLALAAVSLATIFFWPKLWHPTARAPLDRQVHRRISRFLIAVPGTIVVLVGGTLAVSLFDLPVATIGSRFGGIPQGLPNFALPHFSWELVKQLFPPTLTIALLGAIESLLCARVADGITGDRHDPNQELMAQGIANVVTPFFGGLPATGTIARTVTNIRSGATSPIAGIVHALVLLIIVLIAAPWAKDIPLACLAAILLFVAFNMGEWHEFIRLKHFSTNYRILMLTTFLLTVIVDVTTAVEIGLVMACLFFVYRISSLTTIEPILPTTLTGPLPTGIAAYSIYGSLFFGAVGKMEMLIEPTAIPSRAMILELHQLISLDTTGLDMLDTIHKTLHKRGSQLLLCGLNSQPLSLMKRTGFLDRLGPHHCFANLAQAIAFADMLGTRPTTA